MSTLHRPRSRTSEVFDTPDDAPDDVTAMAEHLVSHGIKQAPADKYARGLVDEGYDTVAMFDELSLAELEDTFGFKAGPQPCVSIRGQPPCTTPPTVSQWSGAFPVHSLPR